MEKEKEISEQKKKTIHRLIVWTFNKNPKIPEKSYKYKTEESSYPFLKLLWSVIRWLFVPT